MLVTNPVNFQRFACFYESNESLGILSTIAQNESLKIEIRKSLKIEIRQSEYLRILKFRICESGFVTLNLKDSYHGFVLWIRFWKIRFVDSFCANKNLKLLDSFRFIRIRVRIPHPYIIYHFLLSFDYWLFFMKKLLKFHNLLNPFNPLTKSTIVYSVLIIDYFSGINRRNFILDWIVEKNSASLGRFQDCGRGKR